MKTAMTPADLGNLISPMKVRFSELENALNDPAIYADPAKSGALMRERSRLEAFFALYHTWEQMLKEMQENRTLLETEADPALRELAESELAGLEEKSAEAEKQIMIALIPPDPNDSRNTIVEIKPAAGGDEAALFAAEMFRMYLHYAEKRGWKAEVLDLTETGLGGVKDVTFSLSGADVFSRMKFESGVHRVQRVPATESGGRIHTSTITVSVLAEADELDAIQIRQEDLEISTFRSSGPGGQNVNRTDSAVRIVHKPSGITVASQQERSQIRNREIALRILKSKLLEIRQREEAEKHAESKRQQVGTGERSERIRTYNFPQNRITDHRFGVSAFDLPSLMEGALDLILDPVFECAGRKRLEQILTRQEYCSCLPVFSVTNRRKSLQSRNRSPF